MIPVEEVFKDADAAASDGLTVPPPTQPMLVARDLVKSLYSTPEGLLLLRDHRGDFHRWTGQNWPDVDKRDVRAAAYRLLEHAHCVHPEEGRIPFAPTRRKIDDVVDALRAVVLLDSEATVPTWTDGRSAPAAHETIAMRNGLLHVPTRRLHPHTPAFFNYHALPFAFEKDASPARAWLRFLDELWGQDTDSIAVLQEVMGYLLGGDTRLQKIFLFVGPKRAGKGTIGRVLTGLLGSHNVAAPTLASLSTNFGLAPLIGRPLALVSDARLSTKADSKIVVERLLSVSGEDSLTIDRKYKDPWTGRLATRFLIMTNELPHLSDSSGALASRFILLVLTKSFYGGENPKLTEELLDEAPAIFNWALVGLDRLTARGYFVNPASGAEAIQQLEDLSSPISAFIRDRCVVGSDYTVTVDALWLVWKSWCEGDNRHPGTRAVFGRDLRAVVPTLKRARPRDANDREYTYAGIGLRRDYMAWNLGPLGPPDPEHTAALPLGPSGPRDQPVSPPHSQRVPLFDPKGAFGSPREAADLGEF
jgi:putative DNA primase/helicase